MIPVKTANEVALMKESAAILVNAFKAVENAIDIGITTQELDQIAEQTIRKEGGYPAFKGYHGYPASICASVDCEVVHGIPGSRELKNKEIISIDIGVELNGYFSDAAKTYAIGEISPEKKTLMEVTRRSLYEGIKKCRAGNRLSDISNAVQVTVEENGFSVVRDLVGHGIGKLLHEAPQIPNYGLPHRGPILSAGMVFAIEPMVNLGKSDVKFLDDGWTVETLDGLPSAHFEHSVLITDGAPEILTLDIE